jgi:hypothetical protein
MSKIYLDKEKFNKEIEISLQNGQLTEQAGKMLLMMAKKITQKFRYENEDDRKDCISHAMLQVCKYWKNYNKNVSENAFSFFTSIIFNGLALGWKKINPVGKNTLLDLKNFK